MLFGSAFAIASKAARARRYSSSAAGALPRSSSVLPTSVCEYARSRRSWTLLGVLRDELLLDLLRLAEHRASAPAGSPPLRADSPLR